MSDATAGNLRLRELGSAAADVVYNNQLPSGLASVEGALASRRNGDGSVTLFQLKGGRLGASNLAFNEVFSLTIPSSGLFPNAPSAGNGGYSFVGKFGSAGPGSADSGYNPLSGIAAFDNKLYFAGSADAFFGADTVLPRLGIFEGSFISSPLLKPVMSLGNLEVLQIATAQGRNSIFGAGSLSISSGDVHQAAQEVLFEADPRNNSLLNYFPVSGLSTSAATVFANGAAGSWLSEDRAIRGFTVDAGRLVVVYRSSGPDNSFGNSDDRVFSVIYNPFATRGPTDPAVVRVDGFASSESIKGIAAIPPSGSVSTEASLSFINDGRYDAFGTDPLFNRMAFNSGIASNTAFQQLVHDYIAGGAVNPSTCSSSLSLGTVASALASHVGEAGGVGRAMFDLTTNLAPNSPCTQAVHDPAFFSIFRSGTPTAGDVSRDLFPPPLSTSPTIVGGTADLEPDSGLATIRHPNGDALFYYIAGGQLDPTNFQPIAARNEVFTATYDHNTGSLGGFTTAGLVQTPTAGGGIPSVLTGGAVLEGVLYASRSSSVFSGTILPARIATIDLGARIPQSTDVMNLGMSTKGLAASNERGSLFAAGLYNGGTPQRPAGDGARGSRFSDLALWEFDPRNKYVKNTWWGANNDFAEQANTILDTGFSFTTFTNVGHIGDVGTAGRYVVISADVSVNVQGQGQNSFYITVNPDASNATNPFVTRLTSGAGEDIRALAGIGEAGIFTAPQVPLANPAGGVDTTTINPMFAQMAYSQRALNSGLIEALFKSQFLSTAQNASSCQVSAEFANIPAALQSHVNQVNGIGRAAFDIRNPLSSGHPCAVRGGTPTPP